MQQDISIGSVSWINERPNPVWFSGKAAVLEPDWVPKTYMGLAATANKRPPEKISDFKAFQGDKDFRALMYCKLRVTIDNSSRRITAVRVLDAVHDGGWTPPFKVRSYPLSGLRVWDRNIWSSAWHAGEASPISVVRTEARHPNTTITSIPTGETVLVNGLIKFRAGAHTDRVGVDVVGCPFHVPWVWCEMALTHDGSQFKLYGRGSIFPTHCWYLDGTKVATKDQVGDSSFPSAATHVPGWSPPGWPGMVPPLVPGFSIPRPLTIAYRSLNLYPVLSKGAPAGGGQTALSAEVGLTGKVDTHANTVAAGTEATHP